MEYQSKCMEHQTLPKIGTRISGLWSCAVVEYNEMSKKDKRWCFSAFLFSAQQSDCISATTKLYKHLKIMWNQKKLKLTFALGRWGGAWNGGWGINIQLLLLLLTLCLDERVPEYRSLINCLLISCLTACFSFGQQTIRFPLLGLKCWTVELINFYQYTTSGLKTLSLNTFSF